jgi:hypothetical protein
VCVCVCAVCVFSHICALYIQYISSYV